MRVFATCLLAGLTLTSLGASQATLSTITAASSTGAGNPGVNGPHQHRMAIAGNGDLYTVMQKGAVISLFRSTDDGKTWASVATETNPSTRNAIVADTSCDLLHVAWDGRVGSNRESAFYRVFNTATGKWAGARVALTTPSTSHTFQLQDIEVTPKGTVVVAINTTNAAPTGLRTFTGYLLIKKAGQTTFGAPLLASFSGGSGNGLRCTLQAIGETIHMLFRNPGGGGHNIAYRALDTETMTFGTQRRIDGPGAMPSTLDITNYHSGGADDLGNLYAVYGIGDRSTQGKGEIKIAFAAPPYTSWTKLQVAKDGNIQGRRNTKFISLVHTTGAQVFALYSKMTVPDNLNKLYARELKNGTLLPERTIATGKDNQFHTLWGHRTHQSRAGFIAVIQDENLGPANRTMSFLNNSGNAGHVRFAGYACQGNRTELPLLYTNVPPEAGKFVPLFRLTFAQMPPNSAGILLVGANCLNPIDLTAAGAAGCAIHQDFPIIFGPYTVNANGDSFLPLNIPRTFAGQFVRFQAVSLASGANALGLLFSRSMTIYP